MMRRIAVCLVSLVLTAPAWAKDPKPPPETGGSGMSMDPDMMGPWTRKPTNESKTKKEIEAFFKEEDALIKSRDIDVAISRVDFPTLWVTDTRKGIPKEETYDLQKYKEMMQSMFAHMPADTVMTSKPTITVLSDSLATYTNDFTMISEGKKRSGRNAGLLVKRDGKWKWKTMYEAGWGDAPSSGVGGSGVPEAPEEPK
ncbi:hypothetical protein [Hyalangium rubrum]|uniref:SnoaL-like domain-containing protein n=1 Tax=Hyalangium rubrum TaxID=3103134 RepID=A0ABU5HJI0_9BACT|nr:hypothetical protein [Hyalangium sp. s54d21]MDY7233054.1 hypothetical protein [Hyalangium sp. s54d21]